MSGCPYPPAIKEKQIKCKKKKERERNKFSLITLSKKNVWCYTVLVVIMRKQDFICCWSTCKSYGVFLEENSETAEF